MALQLEGQFRRMWSVRPRQAIVVYIAQRDNVVAESRHFAQIGSASATDADPGHVQFGVGRNCFRSKRSSRKNIKQSHSPARAMQELPSIHFGRSRILHRQVSLSEQWKHPRQVRCAVDDKDDRNSEDHERAFMPPSLSIKPEKSKKGI